jgi:hypothetical protein
MYPCAHLGFGITLSRLLPTRLQSQDKMILVGALLPDILDKTVYYGLSWISGHRGAELGIIAGTRSFGHSAIFLLLITTISICKSWPRIQALAFGIATHVLLDNLGNIAASTNISGTEVRTLLWPLFGLQFPEIPYHDVAEHLRAWANPAMLAGELVGIALLIYHFRGRRKPAGQHAQEFRED